MYRLNFMLSTILILAQASTNAQPAGGLISGPFQLSIKSDQSTYKLGELITVTATIKNVTDHSTDYAKITDPLMAYKMEIQLQSESLNPTPLTVLRRPTTALPKLTHLIGGTLTAGKENIDSVELSKTFYMDTPGIYRIKFSTIQTDENTRGVIFRREGEPTPIRPKSTGKTIVVESNELKIEVLKK